ncbi:sensor histidine kinase [Cohnella hashimotonis]|uniref:Sensor histidine kinase n=1 Tax=Cohnella hashimotonis TaxID=2826895 RepID=A0ABT6TJL9_9BACL|nr:sensor histidine kinase [Cohnella hashimotonis]MDI4647025.1 sensor histidine kinase [Cohnella hashimotonis]
MRTNRTRRPGVFIKIVIGFVIMTLPLLLFSIMTIRAGMNAAVSRAEVSSQSQMNLFMKTMDDELHNIGQMLIALNNDPDLPAYYLQQREDFTFNNVSLYQNLKTKMGLISYSNNYIADVFLIYPDLNKTISFRNGVRPIDARKTKLIEEVSQSDTTYNRYLDHDFLTYTTEFSGLGADPLAVSYYLGVDIYKERIVDALKSLEEANVFKVFLIETQSSRLVEGSQQRELDRDIFAEMGNAIQAKPDQYRVKLQKGTYVVHTRTSTDRLFSIVAYADEIELLKPMHELRRWSAFLWGVTGIVVVLFAFFIYKQIHSPLRKLVGSMRSVEKGDYSSRILLEQGDEFGYVYRQFNSMAQQLQILVQEVLHKKIQLQEAQLKMLQSQINPHFLFNSLYQGYRMAVSGENENVARLCKYLGDYFRFVTRQGLTEHVRLADEIKFTRTYLEIQMLRFSNRLAYELEVEAGLEELLVPVLMLQPLVENAIIHGFESLEGEGRIRIAITSASGGALVSVSDNGSGMSEERKIEVLHSLQDPVHDKEHCGLWNVHQRLLRSFEGSEGLRIASGAHGTSVTFAIDASILALQPHTTKTG